VVATGSAQVYDETAVRRGMALGPPGELGGLLSSAAICAPDQLPPRVVPAIIEFLYGPLAENPHRVGKALRDDFTGLRSAPRGGYRVFYEINEANHSVTVTRVGSRAMCTDRTGATEEPTMTTDLVRVGIEPFSQGGSGA
jgi:mRNA-degrading endonuclease RelE of RelBE toxin-antitoxin system